MSDIKDEDDETYFMIDFYESLYVSLTKASRVQQSAVKRLQESAVCCTIANTFQLSLETS